MWLQVMSGSVFATLTQEDLINLGVSSLGGHHLILNLKLSLLNTTTSGL